MIKTFNASIENCKETMQKHFEVLFHLGIFCVPILTQNYSYLNQ